MPFLNLDLDYFDHPKTTRLIGFLGHGSEILPIRLWTYLAKFHACDGRLLGYSPDAIEQAIRWRGKRGKGLEGLLLVGYLEKMEGGYKAHDWTDHQGHIHALKLRNKKVARNRWKNMKNTMSSVDTSGIPEPNPGVPQSLPFQSFPIQSKPEDKSTSESKDKYIGPPRPTFQRPSIDEIRDFIRSNRYEVAADTFHAYYESNGWKVGRNPMRDWKAAVRTWHGKSVKGGQGAWKNSNGNNSRPSNSAPGEDGSKFDGIGEIVEV